MIEIKVSNFEKEEVKQAARIQVEELGEGFLSSFGENALTVIFQHFSESPWGILVLAVNPTQEKVIGYVFGSIDTGKAYKEFLIRRILTAIRYFLPKMLSIKRIKKAFETLFYPTKLPSQLLPEVELLDLAVCNEYHGTGVAQQLFQAFVEELKLRGIDAFKIPTSASLGQAHKFYEKMGARKIESIEIHEGEETFLYLYEISSWKEGIMQSQLNRDIPFFNYPYLFTSIENELVSIFRDVGRRGAFIDQEDLRDFEQHIAEYTGAKYAVGVANCTDGLQISLLAAGINPGDEVVFCSHTMVATAAAIHHAGAIPIPVECGTDHLIDPESAELAITARTKAIMPTQLNGRTCNMNAIQTIANEHELLIIEDAAQALGSRFKGKMAGTIGIAGAISFYPAKTLGCLGDGGVVLTNDDELYEKMVLLRDHGRNDHGEVVLWGLNSRLDNMQAAILDYKLSNYDQEIARRREIALQYQSQLGDLKELVLPPAPSSDPDHYDIFQNYEIEAERRDGLQAYLKENGVGTLIQWGGKAVHQFEHLGFKVHLPQTEKMFTRCLMLPMNRSLLDEDVDYVCSKIRQYYGRE